jgi:arylsulfatase
MDPFERADHEGIDYWRWRLDRVFMLVPAQAYVGQWLSSFKEFPPRMKPGSFSLDKVMDQLTKETGSGK